MNIAITGKNGYISTYTQDVLTKHAHNAVCVSVRNNLPDFAGYDAVIHCAAIVHRGDIRDESIYNEVNYRLTVRLAQRAKADGVSHFIFLSTMAVYGSYAGEINSNTQLSPITPYAKSKLNAEKAIKELEDAKFKVSIVRPPMVYGEGCRGNYNKLRRVALTFPIVPLVNNKKSFIYIGNLAELLNLICESGQGGVFHPTEPTVGTDSLMTYIIRANGRLFISSRLLGYIIKLLIPCSALVRKVFGTMYYGNIADICTFYGTEDAVRLTEKRNV